MLREGFQSYGDVFERRWIKGGRVVDICLYAASSGREAVSGVFFWLTQRPEFFIQVLEQICHGFIDEALRCFFTNFFVQVTVYYELMDISYTYTYLIGAIENQGAHRLQWRKSTLSRIVDFETSGKFCPSKFNQPSQASSLCCALSVRYSCHSTFELLPLVRLFRSRPRSNRCVDKISSERNLDRIGSKQYL